MERFLSVLLVLVLMACGDKPDNVGVQSAQKPSAEINQPSIINEFTQDYIESVKKPDWYESANYVELKSYADLQKLWSDRKHCCVDKDILEKNHHELFRSCHQAILKNPLDEQLVFNCLYLQGSDIEKDLRLTLKRLGYYHFPDFKTDFSQYRCVNCMVGDSYARLTVSHALGVARENSGYEDGLNIFDDLIERRINDISPWIQSEFFNEYAKLMSYQKEISESRLARLKNAYDRLKKLADEGEETLSWRIVNLEKSIQRLAK